MTSSIRATSVALLAAAAAALPALASPAAAQDGVERIRPGQTVAAALSTGDPRSEERGYFRVYRFDADTGRTYVLALRSTAFDARLEVATSVGPLTEVVADDDDGGGGSNARLRFRPTRAGPHLAVVTAFQGDTARRTGAFELELKEVVERPAAPRPLAVGDSVRGELGDESPVWSETGRAFDVYTFRARRGQGVHAVLRTEPEGEATATVGTWSNGVFEPIRAPTVPSRMPSRSARPAGASDTLVAAEDGEYAVAAATNPGGSPSRYTLRLEETAVALPALRTGRVAPGRKERDALRPTDVMDGARRYREWSHAASGGERLIATMRSTDFDPYLQLGYYARPDSFVVVEENDDWDARDARVTLDTAAAREYVIRAASLNGDTGSYTLRVEARPRVTPRLQVGRIGRGEEVGGELEYSDAALDVDGSPYDHWIYRAERAGERIVVTLTSARFDPILFVGRVENGAFREMWSNDDADDPPQGVQMSRVVAVLREPGDYVIRVNTFGPEESGPYRLKVERAP